MDQFQFQMCLVITDDVKLSYMSKLYNHYNLLYIFFALLYICLILNMLEKSCLKNTLLDNLMFIYFNN